MQELTIPQILDLKDKEPVPAFRCQIKSIKKISSGRNRIGGYTIQNVIVTDGINEIKVKLKNRPELGDDWENIWVMFSSVPGKNNLPEGLTKDDDEYEGRHEKVIWIDAEALMDQSAPVTVAPTRHQPPPQRSAPPQHQPPAQNQAAQQPAPTRQSAPQQPATQRPAATTTQSNQQKPAHSEDPKNDPLVCIEQVTRQLNKVANSMVLALNAAHYAIKEAHQQDKAKGRPETPYTASDIMALAIHLNINIERKGLTDGLPIGPISKHLTPETKKD